MAADFDLSNVKVGDTYPSRQNFYNKIGMVSKTTGKPLTGKSRQDNLDRLHERVGYENIIEDGKETRRIIITAIKSVSETNLKPAKTREKPSNNSPYLEHIQPLLIHHFTTPTGRKESILTTIIKLAYTLRLVNKRFQKGYHIYRNNSLKSGRPGKIGDKVFGVYDARPLHVIEYNNFFEMAYRIVNERLNTALTSLEKREQISLVKEHMILYGKGRVVKAKDEDKKAILEIEQFAITNQLRCEDEDDIREKNLTARYYAIVNQLARNRFGCNSIYTAYTITSLKQFDEDRLCDADLGGHRGLLNSKIIERFEAVVKQDIANNRKWVASEAAIKSGASPFEYPADYFDAQMALADYFIALKPQKKEDTLTIRSPKPSRTRQKETPPNDFPLKDDVADDDLPF